MRKLRAWLLRIYRRLTMNCVDKKDRIECSRCSLCTAYAWANEYKTDGRTFEACSTFFMFAEGHSAFKRRFVPSGLDDRERKNGRNFSRKEIKREKRRKQGLMAMLGITLIQFWIKWTRTPFLGLFSLRKQVLHTQFFFYFLLFSILIHFFFPFFPSTLTYTVFREYVTAKVVVWYKNDEEES